MQSPPQGTGAPLAARELPALLRRLHAALAERREVIDDLNVFPVPDGDTGTNMTLTVRAGVDALDDARPGAPPELARAVIRGALRGARGNSGVILSQVIRAVVEVTTGHAAVDASLFASALRRARDLAYEAVAHPVEGTILTALGAAADAAEAAAERGEDLLGASAAACAATAAAVERTREQLEVLRDAGVVDAGARGFEVLLAAVHAHLSGEELPVRLDEPRRTVRHEPGGCRMTLAQPFEVQYLLDADDEVATPLRERLESLGDSVVVVAAGGLLNVHVHTSQVGPTIEAGLSYGTPSAIEVTHFGDQIAARQAGRDRPPLAVVAVLAGDGLREIARELGAAVVDGAAGALPSVDDLLHAIGSTVADHVLVLPGHRNVVAAAHSAATLMRAEHGIEVTVVEPASNPPAVLAGLAVLDLDGEPGEVTAQVHAAAAAVRAGEVVAAVRDADTPVGSVRAGQPLAVAAGDVVAAATTPLEALEHVGVVLDVVDAEIVTLLVGADVDADERAAAVGVIAELTEAELEVVDAGLRPSRYWIGVE